MTRVYNWGARNPEQADSEATRRCAKFAALPDDERWDVLLGRKSHGMAEYLRVCIDKRCLPAVVSSALDRMGCTTGEYVRRYRLKVEP